MKTKLSSEYKKASMISMPIIPYYDGVVDSSYHTTDSRIITNIAYDNIRCN